VSSADGHYLPGGAVECVTGSDVGRGVVHLCSQGDKR